MRIPAIEGDIVQFEEKNKANPREGGDGWGISELLGRNSRQCYDHCWISRRCWDFVGCWWCSFSGVNPTTLEMRATAVTVVGSMMTSCTWIWMLSCLCARWVCILPEGLQSSSRCWKVLKYGGSFLTTTFESLKSYFWNCPQCMSSQFGWSTCRHTYQASWAEKIYMSKVKSAFQAIWGKLG